MYSTGVAAYSFRIASFSAGLCAPARGEMNQRCGDFILCVSSSVNCAIIGLLYIQAHAGEFPVSCSPEESCSHEEPTATVHEFAIDESYEDTNSNDHH